MQRRRSFPVPPKLVVLEGADGVGKSTLAELLVRYYRQEFPQLPVTVGAFPGREPGTLGDWVYRLHHGEIEAAVAPPALQLLHVAAHVDAIFSWISPSLVDGCVILDRYWWSTYAYARTHLKSEDAWALVAAEQSFWRPLPRPVIFYLTRSVSLKPDELDAELHGHLDRYYGEVIECERFSGTEVHELSNDGDLGDCLRQLLAQLGLEQSPI